MAEMGLIRNPILETAMNRSEKKFYEGGIIGNPNNVFAHTMRMEFNQRGINVDELAETTMDDNVEINTTPENDAGSASEIDPDKIEVMTEQLIEFICDHPFLMVQYHNTRQQIINLSYRGSLP